MRAFIKMAILIVATVTLANAQTGEKEKVELKEAMHSFASAMEMIQHGILYNNFGEMRKGAELIRRNEYKFLKHHGNALEKQMPENPEFARSYSKLTAKRIRDYTDRLSAELGSVNDYSKFAATYTHILHECVGCHQKIRKW